MTLGGPRRPLSTHRWLFVLSGRRRRPGDPETSIYVAASDITAAAGSASTSLPPRPHFPPGINPSRRSPRPRSTLPRQTRPPRPDQSRRSTRPRRIFRLYRLCLFDRPSFTTIGTTPTNGRVLAFRGRIIVTIGPGCALSYVRLQGRNGPPVCWSASLPGHRAGSPRAAGLAQHGARQRVTQRPDTRWFGYAGCARNARRADRAGFDGWA